MRWYDYIFILHLEKLRLREIKNFINPVLHFPLKPAHLPTAMLKQHEQNIIFPFSSSVFIYIMPIFFFIILLFETHRVKRSLSEAVVFGHVKKKCVIQNTQ